MLGTDSGLAVQAGEQGKEVVGRQEEEEGNWKMWVGNANAMVGDTLGVGMWAGLPRPRLWSSHVGWGEEQRPACMLLPLPPVVVLQWGWRGMIILPKVPQSVDDTVDSNLSLSCSKCHALTHHPNLPPHWGAFFHNLPCAMAVKSDLLPRPGQPCP